MKEQSKKTKGMKPWIWVLVPALIVVVAIVVYKVSSATRTTEAFITYTRVMEWTGEGEKTGSENTRMEITSGGDETYSLVVPEGVTAYADNSEEDYEEEDDLAEYKMEFPESEDQKTITISGLDTSEKAAFCTDETISMDGSYDTDISCENYNFNGTFTNKTGSEIKNAVFMSDGCVYQLGTIKDGETVKISDKCENLMAFSSEVYQDMDSDSDFRNLFGLPGDDDDDTLEQKRYANAIGYYSAKSGTQFITQGKVIGIINSDGVDEEMTQSWGMDCSGITMGVFPVDVNYTNKEGQTFVPDLVSRDTSGSKASANRYFYDEEVTIEYALKSNETLTGLYYFATANEENMENGKLILEDESMFEGDISAYNYETKEYERIFEGGKAGEIKDVKRFVGTDNKLLLKIVTKDFEGDYTMPVISATKEGK